MPLLVAAVAAGEARRPAPQLRTFPHNELHRIFLHNGPRRMFRRSARFAASPM
jgi:hypothetical protein